MDVARPVIPRDEFPRRWRSVQALMQAEGLDLLVAYGNDRAVFGPAHVRWLADVPVHFEPMAVLVPPAGDPVLVCGPESDQYALRVGPGSRRARAPRVHPPGRGLPVQPHRDPAGDRGRAGRLRGVGGQARHRGPRPPRCRHVGRPGGGAAGRRWVDVEHAMCGLRARKSAAEIAVIRHAYRLAAAGLEAAVAAIHPGVTESAVAAEAEAAMRRAGAEGTGIDTIVASGPNARPILARATFREIDRDDLVVLTLAPRYQGYHGAIGRPVFVGEPGCRGEGGARRRAACAGRLCCADPAGRRGPRRRGGRAPGDGGGGLRAGTSSTPASTAWA